MWGCAVTRCGYSRSWGSGRRCCHGGGHDALLLLGSAACPGAAWPGRVCQGALQGALFSQAGLLQGHEVLTPLLLCSSRLCRELLWGLLGSQCWPAWHASLRGRLHLLEHCGELLSGPCGLAWLLRASWRAAHAVREAAPCSPGRHSLLWGCCRSCLGGRLHQGLQVRRRLVSWQGYPQLTLRKVHQAAVPCTATSLFLLAMHRGSQIAHLLLQLCCVMLHECLEVIAPPQIPPGGPSAWHTLLTV